MRKISIISLGIFVCLISIQANAVTQEEIAASIMDGITWLVGQQNDDGSWSSGGQKVASTAFALVKLEDLAYEREKSPFDEEYEYYQQVIAGLDYIFREADQYGNVTTGICFGKGHNVNYNTGITMMAIAAGRVPERLVNVEGSIVNGWTYREVLQANVEFYASYQDDGGSWPYEPSDLGGGDNSITGYVILGSAYAEEPLYGFNCTIPEGIKNKLNNWIDHIQVDSDTPHNGGSGYGGEYTSNVLRAGNLIFEMAFVGDTPYSSRMQRALAFLGRAWNDPDWLWEDIHSYPGWYGNPDWDGEPYKDEMPLWWLGLDERWGGWDGPHFQAMYCLMKGLTYAGIDTINVEGSDVEWYDAFTARILFAQNDDGSWDRDYWGDPILATEWALLTLEAISPPEQFIEVFIDIKPGSCPNPLNPKSKGVVPVTVLGTEEFDVYTIDPSSISLTLNGNGGSVASLRWAFEDVATTFTGEPCDCHDYNGDGYLDLTLKFKAQELVYTLDLDSYGGETIPLTLTGKLMEDYGGTPFSGQDCVRILKK